MNFNESQLTAVKHGNHPMLVIAGPGSGKTTVLTNRIKNLMVQYNVNPSNILVITFTKAAATEMQNRFSVLMGEKTKVTFGTFHAVFFTILKAAYNYSTDCIIRDDKKRYIIREAILSSGVCPEDINEMTENVAGEISKVKGDGNFIESYHSVNLEDSQFKYVFNYYNKALKREKKIDFDDMLIYCKELLEQRKDILKSWQKKYKYILIDEFQDINKTQYDVIKMLAFPENNLFIVGDDDQSIYGFRGSKPEIMLNFEQDYPETKKVVLDTNYRSTGNIVEAAGKVIEHNKVRFNKKITTINENGSKVEIREFNNIDEEYQKIIDEIRNGNPSDYAVLYRTNSVAVPLVRKLMEYNIPFAMKDGIPDIFDHWIAKDVLTYMAIAEGSRKRSDFLQIINRPKRYISRDYLTDSEISLDKLEKMYTDKDWMAERIDRLKYDIKMMGEMAPYAMINYLRKGVGYDDFLKEYAEERCMDVQELQNVLDEIHESSKNCRNFYGWYKYIDDYKKLLNESRHKQKDYNAVSLTTMHGSKGLEYDKVYIIDANEGITPHKKSVTEAEIEEERRMFYVAMTRAKKQLNIFYAKERFNKKMEPSRFLDEIMNENRSL